MDLNNEQYKEVMKRAVITWRKAIRVAQWTDWQNALQATNLDKSLIVIAGTNEHGKRAVGNTERQCMRSI